MANGASERWFALPRNRVYVYALDGKFFLSKTVLFHMCAQKFLLIEDGAKNGDGKMRKVGGAFVKLQPANHAMVGKVLCYLCLGDSKVFGELRFDGFRAAASAAAN